MVSSACDRNCARGIQAGLTHDTVSACVLRRVQRGIGASDELFAQCGGIYRIAGGYFQAGDAYADGPLKFHAALTQDSQFQNLGPDALCEYLCPDKAGSRNQDCKFLTPKSRHGIDIARNFAAHICQRLYCPITCRVSVAVVDTLEVIDIEHEEGWKAVQIK